MRLRPRAPSQPDRHAFAAPAAIPTPRRTTRKLHRWLGIVLLLPFLGWVATGFVFFLKPGYAKAYQTLSVRTYPLAAPCAVQPADGWLEVRCLRTVLGDHLLVRTVAGWRQLDPANRQPRNSPAAPRIAALLNDAFQTDPARYGTVASLSGLAARTTTGVEVALDWDQLSLRQRGPDTDRIDLLYRIHYLQWTGIASLDRLLGALALTFVLALTLLGLRLALRRA
jgi:PepSY-associated TM region